MDAHSQSAPERARRRAAASASRRPLASCQSSASSGGSGENSPVRRLSNSPGLKNLKQVAIAQNFKRRVKSRQSVLAQTHHELVQVGDEVLALVPGGSYAEYVAVDATTVMRKPRSMSWAEAASVPEAWLTASLNLRLANVSPGETVLIHAAASGVGVASVQLARAAGVETCADLHMMAVRAQARAGLPRCASPRRTRDAAAGARRSRSVPRPALRGVAPRLRKCQDALSPRCAGSPRRRARGPRPPSPAGWTCPTRWLAASCPGS